MRIATSTLYDRGLDAIGLAQATLSKTQEQLSTGKRVSTPSDDPVAATEILRTTSSLANNTQLIANQGVAQQLLGQTDSTLGQVGDALQSIRTTLVSANSGALTDSERAALGTQLSGQLDSLISLANTKDGDGHFLFGGYRSDTAPFARTTTGASYAGDDGNRVVQVSATRQIASTANGNDVFNRISSGNGVFTTQATSTNTGGGIVDTGKVVTPAALTGHAYQVQFSVANGATTYQVIDTTTNTAVAAPATSGNTFTAGTAIAFDGLQMTITGAPANGDSFTVAPSTKQSVFQMLQNAVDLLSKPTGGTAGVAQLTAGLLGSISNIDNALDHVNTVRASVGVRENEVDALGTSSAATDTAGQAHLSDLQDTDYASAVATLAKQQAALTAAQKTFTAIGNKTLFDYL